MSMVQAVVLGLIQGITEFLPVSSSGHLIIIPRLFGWPDQGIAFDVVVHVGTLLAVIIFFRKKIWTLMTALISTHQERRHEKKIAWSLLFSVVPAGIAGYIIETNDRSALVVGISLIIWGIILGIADRYSMWLAKKNASFTTLETLSIKQIVLISCAQALALIPGTSRSGITMTTGLFAKLDKKTAAECSFLMGTPIIALAGIVKLIELGKYGIGNIPISALCIGFVVSAVSGLFAITCLMNVIKKWSFLPFAIYRVLIGILILLVLL